MTGTQVRNTAIFTALDPKVPEELEAAVRAYTPHLSSGLTPEGVARTLTRDADNAMIVIHPGGGPSVVHRSDYAADWEPVEETDPMAAFAAQLAAAPEATDDQSIELEAIVLGHAPRGHLSPGDSMALVAAILDAGFRKS